MTAQSDADALEEEDSRNLARDARASGEFKPTREALRLAVSIEAKLRLRRALPPA